MAQSRETTQNASATGGGLRRALRLRHLITMSVGGTIASGFLLASGGAVALAGPGVIVTYIVGGLVLLGVMACLSELTVQGQTAGGFAIYAQNRLGPWFGFMTGWNYWLAWVAGMAAEGIAIGTYMTSFPVFHAIPVWLIAVVVITLDLGVNLIGVQQMGNYEFTLTMIKIIAMVVFIVVCIGAMVGIGGPAVGAQNLTSHGGFLPNGPGGLLTAFLLVFFAYAGIEMVSVSAEESVTPERDVPRALMGTTVLVMILFVGAIFALNIAVDWHSLGTSSSPLFTALTAIHMPLLANLIVLGIIVASISAIDSSLYTASRMLFALSREGYFPKGMANTHPTRKVPVMATLVCAGATFLCVLLDVISPTYAYVFLGSLGTLGFIWAYFLIPVLQIVYRSDLTKDQARNLSWKVPFHPVIPVICLFFVAVALIAPIFQNTPGLFGISGGALPVVAGAIWVLGWTVYYLTLGRGYRRAAAAEQPVVDPAIELGVGE
jgi:L-asparagine transporter-like permease